jgi:hypothetical protein
MSAWADDGFPLQHSAAVSSRCSKPSGLGHSTGLRPCSTTDSSMWQPLRRWNNHANNKKFVTLALWYVKHLTNRRQGTLSLTMSTEPQKGATRGARWGSSASEIIEQCMAASAPLRAWTHIAKRSVLQCAARSDVARCCKAGLVFGLSSDC